MNVKKIIKAAMICGVVYMLTDVSYQMGKGYILGLMKKRNHTVDEMIEIVKTEATCNVRSAIIDDISTYVQQR